MNMQFDAPGITQSIVEKALAGKAPAAEPSLLWVAAPPNCGKSTMLELLYDKGIIDTSNTVIISGKLFKDIPDVKALKKSGAMHPEKTGAFLGFYYDTIEAVAKAAAEKGISIVIEDHADYAEKVNAVIARVDEAGRDYEKVLIGVTPSKERFFLKTETRAAEGKQVDHAWIMNIVRAFSANWDENVKHFDYAALYYRKDINKPDLIAEFTHHGTEQKIHDDKAYALFERQRNIDPRLPPEDAWKAAEEPTGLHSDASGVGGGGGEDTATRWGRLAREIESNYSHYRKSHYPPKL